MWQTLDSYLYTFDSSPAVVLFDVHVNFCIPDKTERKGEKNVEGDSCVYSYEDKNKKTHHAFIQILKDKFTHKPMRVLYLHHPNLFD